MATFKAVVYADNKKQDGTYNVKIRTTHRSHTLKVSTALYVTAEDLTRGKLKIKAQRIIDTTDGIIKRWREITNSLGASADNMSVKELVEHIKNTEKHGATFRLDFIAYGRRLAASMRWGTRKSYITALNTLERFVGGKIDVNDITAQFMRNFEQFIIAEPVQRKDRHGNLYATDRAKDAGRAISSYPAHIRAIHNAAKREFNDDEVGLIRIPRSPFGPGRYEVKPPPKPKRRAVELELVQSIINLDNELRAAGSKADFTRHDLARDCYLLSFGLAGMNAADLLACPAQSLNGNVIIYNRMKTASRRADAAEMHIRIEPCIKPLVEKYKDPTGARLFCFHLHYKDGSFFNAALNQGLKRIDATLRKQEIAQNIEAGREADETKLPPHITFYSGRHTWATVARSAALNIDKYTVHEALNHVDDNMKMTDVYTERDWSVIWKANADVIGLLDWSAVHERAESGKKSTENGNKTAKTVQN